MAVDLTDEQILELIGEPKRLPPDYNDRLVLRPKHGHNQRELAVEGDGGNTFRLILRQSQKNPLDFSVILAYQLPGTNRVIRLRRYNGRHQHSNKLEGETLYDFHIHEATERYQGSGFDPETFAVASDRYSTIDEALTCMLHDCAFVPPEGSQVTIYDLGHPHE